ncbi:MAG: hypothetical protein FJX29_14860 [Alphaproteobacteria bacterium]|nr:hypothetical protein [Alphaproteobacteria bacterium]
MTAVARTRIAAQFPRKIRNVKLAAVTLGAFAIASLAVFDSRAQESGARSAQSPAQASSDLRNYYELELAFALCPHVKLDGRDLIRLDDTIRLTADKLDLPLQDIELMAAELETGARADTAAFCSRMATAA